MLRRHHWITSIMYRFQSKLMVKGRVHNVVKPLFASKGYFVAPEISPEKNKFFSIGKNCSDKKFEQDSFQDDLEQLSHLKEHKSDKIRDIVNKYETNLPVLQKLITGYLNASFKQIMTNVTARDLAAEQQQISQSFGKFGFYKKMIPFADGANDDSLTISYGNVFPTDKFEAVRKFLVCDTEKEKSCRVASLVSLYGTGKTYCMYYLAHQCGLYVIPVHSLLSPLKKMIANMESEQVAHFLEKESSRMLRLYAFCSKIVIHENNLTCTDFLRFMMNGGKEILSNLINAIGRNTSFDCGTENEAMLLVFDDVEKDLTKIAKNLITLNKDKIQGNFYMLDDLGSLFNIVYRTARSIASSIFMGTCYEMHYIEESEDDGNTTATFSDITPVFSHNVIQFLQDLFNIDDSELHFLRFYLQGRPMHFEVFVNNLHSICLKDPCTKQEFYQMSAKDQHKYRKKILEQAMVSANQAIASQYLSKLNALIDSLSTMAKPSMVPLRIALFGAIEANACNRTEMVELSKHAVAHFSLSHTVARVLEPQFMKTFIDTFLHKGEEQESKFLKALEHYVTINSHNAAKVFLAYLLMDMSRTNWNKPLTDHQLFTKFKGSYLDNYKLVVRYYHYDQDAKSIARDLRGGRLEEDEEFTSELDVDNMGLAPSMIRALTENITVSAQEKEVMDRFELPTLILFMPEFARPTIMAMLVPITGRGRCIPLTCAVTGSVYEFKYDYIHTDISTYLHNRTIDKAIEKSLSKIDPAKALRILVAPKLKLFNTSLQEVALPHYHQSKKENEFSLINTEGHCVTLWSVENLSFMEYLKQHPRSESLVKIFNKCSEAFELYV